MTYYPTLIPPTPSHTERLVQSPAFLAACRREPTPFTPIWLMRQAGRFMPEYRAVRDRLGFLELCKRPDAAAEVTVTAARALGVDAAIIFADILLVVEPLGLGLTYGSGDGPKIERPIRTAADVERLPAVSPGELGYVYDAIRLARAALPSNQPLIGFAAAPFTLATYMIEGGASPAYVRTKDLMRRDPGVWRTLMERLVAVLGDYLNAQIDAGAQAVQLFDSWVGTLPPTDYRTHVLPHTRALIAALGARVPVIHFGTGTAGLLEGMRAAGGDVIGLDWRIDLDAGWARVGHDVAVQGNLDPTILFAAPAEIRRHAQAILGQAAGRPGHIFNLGHGVLPDTPVDHVRALVDAVHELSAR
jgi:uroporphyrinogen decarboxylase